MTPRPRLLGLRFAPLALACAGGPALADRAVAPDPPMVCDRCEEWNADSAPFRVFGNTYYVGPAGLGAILIDGGEEGLILIDGGLTQSAQTIAFNIRELGFEVQDIELIAVSHEHYDHAGGISALQRASGAPVLASPAQAAAFADGGATPEDPQYGYRPEADFPAIANVVTIADGQSFGVGDAHITPHFTPGHTPGGISWTWTSCEGDGAEEVCRAIAYVDSLTSVSAPDYDYADHPDMVAAFRRTFETVAALPCDIFLTTHPDPAMLAAGQAGESLADPGACRAAAEAAEAALDRRLAQSAAPDDEAAVARLWEVVLDPGNPAAERAAAMTELGPALHAGAPGLGVFSLERRNLPDPLLDSDPRTPAAYVDWMTAELQAVRDWLNQPHPDRSVADRLYWMYAAADLGRALFRLERLADRFGDLESARPLPPQLWETITLIDQDNTARLDAMLDDRLWFDDSEDGAGASYWATMIAVHSDARPDLQRAFLERIEQTVADGAAPPGAYPWLADRVGLASDGLQLYGTQIECADGAYRPRSVRAPEALDERRAEFGLGPMADALARLGSCPVSVGSAAGAAGNPEQER